MLLAGRPVEAAIYYAGTIASFTNRINSALPGDQIILSNGVYATSGPISVTNSGTVTQPIVIAAQTIGGVEITGRSGFQLNGGDYIILRGFYFTHTNNFLFVSSNSTHCRITQNTFEINPVSPWLRVSGDDTEVDHNLFRNGTAGQYLQVYDGNNATAQRLWAHHNHFFRNLFPGTNGGESLQIGQGTWTVGSAWAVAENNVFEQANGDSEIMSIKTADNLIRYNTLTNSRGDISLRYASRCNVEGNFVFSSGGISFYGDDHFIFNNYLQGATNGIRFGYGSFPEISYRYIGPNHPVAKRGRAEFNTLVNCATYLDLLTGADNPPFFYPTDGVAANNLLQGDQGAFVGSLLAAYQSNFTWQSNLFWGGASYAGSPAGGYLKLDPLLATNTAVPFHLAANSPALGASFGAPSEMLFDLDGQLRPAIPAIGADEYSTAAIVRRPLGSNDVGPYATATNFDLAAMPWSQTVMPGGSTRYTNCLSAFNGFAGTVTFSVGNLPAGVTASFNPASLSNGVGVSVLNITTSNNLAPGRYTVLITAASDSLTNTTAARLVVGKLPAANWVDVDIGAPALSGSADYYQSVLAVKGGGAGIAGTSDQCHLVYLPWTNGNTVTLTALVATQPNTSNADKSGLMLRETTNANSKFVQVVALPNALKFEARTTTGGNAVTLATFAATNSPVFTNSPVWVKLVNAGGSFTGYVSADGSTWARLGSTNVTFASLLAGLAVSSGNNSRLNTTVFENVGFLAGAVPVITNQPDDQVVPLGANALLSAGATGPTPLTYQWWFNATNLLAGATNATLTITNAQIANEGAYFVVVSNASGAVTSSVATLLVNVVASTNVFLDAHWLDATRTNNLPPANSAWYASTASSLVAASNRLVALPDATTTMQWWTYFTTNAQSAIQLSRFDTLRVTLAFIPYGVNPSNGATTGLRIGVYDSRNGVRRVADGGTPSGAGYLGCMLGTTFGQVFGSSLQLYQRTNVIDGNLMGSTTTAYMTLDTGGPAAGDPGFSNGVPYTLQMLIHRNTNAAEYSVTFADTNGWQTSAAATWTNAYLTYAYDTFAIRAATNAINCTNFTFTGFKVELVATNNHLPMAAAYATNTAQNKPVAIPLTKLLAGAYDPDGDPVEITAVSPASAHGGTATLANGNLVYAPPVNYSGSDSINYTLTDYRGASGGGQVLVAISGPPAFTNASLSADRTAFTVMGTGAVAQLYVVQTSMNLTLPSAWAPAATNTLTNGVFRFTDTATTNSPRRFYRLVIP